MVSAASPELSDDLQMNSKSCENIEVQTEEEYSSTKYVKLPIVKEVPIEIPY